jgi:hypothetical protein
VERRLPDEHHTSSEEGVAEGSQLRGMRRKQGRWGSCRLLRRISYEVVPTTRTVQ